MITSKRKHYSSLGSSIPNMSYCRVINGLNLDNRFNSLNSVNVFLNESFLIKVIDSLYPDIIKIKTLILIANICERHSFMGDNSDKKRRGEGWVNLMSSYSRKFYGTRDWPEILKCAEFYNLIEIDQSWSFGKHSMSFRCNSEIIKNGEMFSVKYTGSIIKAQNKHLSAVNRMIRRGTTSSGQNSQFSEDRNGFDDLLINNLKLATMSHSAKDIVDILEPDNRDVLLSQLLYIESGHRKLTSDSNTGRRFHNFVCLPKEARQAILLEGEQCAELDYSAFHPNLMLGLYPNDCQEKGKYKKILEIGFYEEIASLIKYELTDFNKKAFKQRCMTEIFYDVERKYYDVFNAFFLNFPILGRIILDEKSESNSKFAIKMQNIEANFIFDKVFPVLSDKNIVSIPIHDAIICKSKEAIQVREIMESLFLENFGQLCSVKNKDLTLNSIL